MNNASTFKVTTNPPSSPVPELVKLWQVDIGSVFQTLDGTLYIKLDTGGNTPPGNRLVFRVPQTGTRGFEVRDLIPMDENETVTVVPAVVNLTIKLL